MPNRPDKIKRAWKPERVAFGRRKDNSAFYNGRKWRKVSLIFREANPICKECLNNDTVGPADVCDHIEGLDNLINSGRDPYDMNNLQSLCHKHHNIKSGRESNKYKGG